MAIILLGMPGAGKGTVAKALAKEIDYKHLSTGELLRKEVKKETELGKEIKDLIQEGNLVPNGLMTQIVFDELKEDDDVILDGFPRTVTQARKLMDMEKSGKISIEAIIFLDVTEETIWNRLRRRRKIENRPDDTDEVIAKRIKESEENLTDMIQQVFTAIDKFEVIDAEESVEKNVDDILEIFNRRKE